MTYANQLANKVKMTRANAGLSQTDFAERLGVKQSYLSAMERGAREVPMKIANALIEHFQVSPDWLFDNNSDSANSTSVLASRTSRRTNQAAKTQSSTTKPKKSATNSRVLNNEKRQNNLLNRQEQDDLLFGQQGPSEPRSERTPEEQERAAMFNELWTSNEPSAYAELQRLRADPNYFYKARKLAELREKLRHDMFRTEPELSEVVAGSQVFGMLTHNLIIFHLRYLNTFVDASYNYHNAAGPLSETPVEKLTYPEYRDAMLREAAKLQPFIEAVHAANTKMEEILRLLLPFDNAGLIDKFLID